MPVDTIHPDYTAKEIAWKRCRDVYAGQDAVHAAGESYLPKLKDQEPLEYNGYKQRATFYNATYRTITGLSGMLFSRPPVCTLPPSIDEMQKDITMSGVPLHLLVQEVATDALTIGRIGILVDYPLAPPGATQADAKAQNLRPTMQLYKAESIINWKTGSINNKLCLIQLVLKECASIPEDEFKSKDEIRYRVLDLINKKYRIRVFRKKGDNKDEQIGVDQYPTMQNKPIDYIPFVIIGTDSVTPEVVNPPLIDLVDMNLSHYRSTADYEHGAHYTGLPTPVVTGVTLDTGEKLSIGSGTAWVFKSKDAQANFLEFTGQGLKALDDILTRKENQMAILGARMLEPQKKGVQTAETEAIHRKGEESMLSSVSQVISLGVTIALKWFAEWAGADSSEVEYELNRDFFPVALTPQEITSLLALWQGGAISDQTLFDNLQQGDIISHDTTLEEEQTRIANSKPALTGQNPDGTPPAPLPEVPNQSYHFHLPKAGGGNKTMTGPKGQTYHIKEG